MVEVWIPKISFFDITDDVLVTKTGQTIKTLGGIGVTSTLHNIISYNEDPRFQKAVRINSIYISFVYSRLYSSDVAFNV